MRCLAIASTAAAFLAVCSVCGPVLAQPAPTDQERANARANADAGLELFDAGKFAEAFLRFERAESVVHAPPHLLYMARSRAKLGRLRDAIAIYQRIVGETVAADAPKVFVQAQASAKTELAALRARAPALRVLIPAADQEARVDIDGVTVPRSDLSGPILLDPGAHHVVVTSAGREPTKRDVTLVEGGPVTTLDFDAAAPPAPAESAAPPADTAPSPEPPSAGGGSMPIFIAFGVGAVGLGAGVATGLMAVGKANELKDTCPHNPCSPTHQALADDSRAFGTVSTVAFIVGGVGVAAGVTLVVLRAKKPAPSAPSAALWLGPRSAMLDGRF